MNKIAFIGSFHRNWDEEGIAKSFEKIGVQVMRFEESNFNITQFKSKIRSERPDLLLFAKLKLFAGKDEVLNCGLPTVSWSFDLFRGLPRSVWVYSHEMFKANLVLTPDGGSDGWWKKHNINHKVLRQGIFDEYCYQSDENKKYDVVFVGSQSSNVEYRKQLTKMLSQYNFHWVGRENTFETRGHDLNKLYSQSKIVIGDSVPSDHYWSNRIYEVLGRGGFLISPKVKGLENEYDYYNHFVPYTSLDSLQEKIDYFLTKEDERNKIAQAGFEHTKKNHTLINRCEEFIKLCESYL